MPAARYAAARPSSLRPVKHHSIVRERRGRGTQIKRERRRWAWATYEELAGVGPGGLVEALDSDDPVAGGQEPAVYNVGRLLAMLGDDVVRGEPPRGRPQLLEPVLAKHRYRVPVHPSPVLCNNDDKNYPNCHTSRSAHRRRKRKAKTKKKRNEFSLGGRGGIPRSDDSRTEFLN